jgi:hypothetical protein
VSKTRNIVEGVLTLAVGLALVTWVIAGVLGQLIDLDQPSYSAFEILIGLFVVGAAGFIGVVFTMDGWRQTLSGLRQGRSPQPGP